LGAEAAFANQRAALPISGAWSLVVQAIAGRLPFTGARQPETALVIGITVKSFAQTIWSADISMQTGMP
jgi:hypothetical protein